MKRRTKKFDENNLEFQKGKAKLYQKKYLEEKQLNNKIKKIIGL